MAARKRGIGNAQDLYARSERRPGSSCWWWTGARETRGGRQYARLWTFCHDAGEKRSMSGPRAVWNITQGCGLGDRIATMRCLNPLCVNPGHVRAVEGRAIIGAALAESGMLKGSHMDVRRANIAKAFAAQGGIETPPEIVQAIRSAPASVTGRALARLHGLTRQAVSKIRLGQRRAQVSA